jgi:hypothetical protein
MQSHWVAFPMLVPGIIMLILHRHLGLSDALNIPTPPGEREAHLFNWVMVALIYLGAGVCFAHAFIQLSLSRRWFFAKLIVLALYWGLLMLV